MEFEAVVKALAVSRVGYAPAFEALERHIGVLSVPGAVAHIGFGDFMFEYFAEESEAFAKPFPECLAEWHEPAHFMLEVGQGAFNGAGVCRTLWEDECGPQDS